MGAETWISWKQLPGTRQGLKNKSQAIQEYVEGNISWTLQFMNYNLH